MPSLPGGAVKGFHEGGAMKGGLCEGGAMMEPPSPVGQQVGGMHPTGMHSCSVL